MCSLLRLPVSANYKLLNLQTFMIIFPSRTRKTSDVPLSDPDLVVLVTNSEYKHDLKPPEGEKGEYEKRRDSCMSATRKFGRDPDKNQFLKDISMEELEGCFLHRAGWLAGMIINRSILF